MGDEHRLRKAQIRHRELELEGRRVDARIASLESLATQATLLAGFSYAVLAPDSVGGLLSPTKLHSLSGICIAFSTITSFCSALWVVYLTGYASIKARVTFLQGARTRAVDATITILIETQNYSRYYFDLSLGALVAGAMLVVLKEAGWLALPLLAVFAAFLLNGAIYKRRIDSELSKWTSKELMADNISESCGLRIDRMEAWVHRHSELVHSYLGGFLDWLKIHLRAIPWLQQIFSGPKRQAQYQPFSSGAASAPRQHTAIDAEIQSAERGFHRCASSAAMSSSPPPIVHSSSAPGLYFPLSYRGWAYKSRAFNGDCRKNICRPNSKRFLVFSQEGSKEWASRPAALGEAPTIGNAGLIPIIRVFSHAEYADLYPAKKPSRTIDLSKYALVCSTEDYEQERLGLQHCEHNKQAHLSWWIRCPDSNSFRQLHNLLLTVTQAAALAADEAAWMRRASAAAGFTARAGSVSGMGIGESDVGFYSGRSTSQSEDEDSELRKNHAQ